MGARPCLSDSVTAVHSAHCCHSPACPQRKYKPQLAIEMDIIQHSCAFGNSLGSHQRHGERGDGKTLGGSEREERGIFKQQGICSNKEGSEKGQNLKRLSLRNGSNLKIKGSHRPHQTPKDSSNLVVTQTTPFT